MFHVCLIAVGCNDDVIHLYLPLSLRLFFPLGLWETLVRIKANTWDDLVQLQESQWQPGIFLPPKNHVVEHEKGPTGFFRVSDGIFVGFIGFYKFYRIYRVSYGIFVGFKVFFSRE